MRTSNATGTTALARTDPCASWALLHSAAMSVVQETRTGDVVTVTLNRPDRLNAVCEELYAALLAAIAAAEADRSVRALVLTGAGSAFCVGADLKGHHDTDREEGARRRYVELGQRAARAVLTSRLPVIAAVNGHAIGAGLELALACDLSVVAADAKLRLPELALGTFVGGGVTRTLPARVGMTRARRLLFLAEFFSGEHAAAIGLCTESAPAAQVLPRALELARTTAGLAPRAVARMKQVLLGTEATLDAALAAEAAVLSEMMTTKDWREGIEAFAARREPRFTGD